jgi:hypothetical protein
MGRRRVAHEFGRQPRQGLHERVRGHVMSLCAKASFARRHLVTCVAHVSDRRLSNLAAVRSNKRAAYLSAGIGEPG